MQNKIIKKIRETNFPIYPSRLKCIFLFSDIEDAICFIKKNYAEIWKVKLLNGKMAKCDQNIFNKWLNGNQNTGHDEIAYWSGNKSESPLWEILFEGNLKLIKTQKKLIEEMAYLTIRPICHIV